jgi:hypothetical protein
LSNENDELIEWVEHIKNHTKSPSSNEIVLPIDEYCKVFSICSEVRNPMYDPIRYKQLYEQIRKPKPRLRRKYMPIIDCAIKHREIMYIQYYKKEIISLLDSCIRSAETPIDVANCSIEAYSAALEFNYCKLYYIECEKEDLIKKYNISSILFDSALKDLKLDFGNKLIF